VARKYYQMPYDDELDLDIVALFEKLDKLPKDRKAEAVRSALRLYMDYIGEKPRLYFPMASFGEGVAPVVTQQAPVAEKKRKRKRPGFTGDEFE
jgi:hypothetical protein